MKRNEGSNERSGVRDTVAAVRNERKPLQGIRQIEQQNIDVVYNMIKKTAHSKINSSQIQDIEVAMLPKQSTAVINYLNRIHKKKP